MNAVSHFQLKKNFFPLMLVTSLLCHALLSLFLLQPHRVGDMIPPVPVFDLTMTTPVIPSPVVKPATAVQPVAAEPEAPASPAPRAAQTAQNTSTTTPAVPEDLHKSGIELGLTNGYFSGIGEGETLRDDIREYYFAMLRQINEKWWLQPGSHQGAAGNAIVNLVIAKDGVVVRSLLVQGSGNPVFDRQILQAVTAASPLPPLPESYGNDLFSAPLRFKAPLSLMSS
ncbi:energy transducer TonB [Geobacter sp. AOG1]|uniref:energy transducer TonB n=1 Tax=Geobacter sp. AOG1 TaxID=1566346 RepID=UPI001CC33D7E|nr:TonB family protein [Geobacter sp. AOG1]GFE58345.1 hypothetical protein AOG1_22250 [Geobacter sp. AOG1]